MSRQHGRAFSLQLGRDAFAMTLADQVIALAGLWPMDGYQEAWFMVTPALRRKSVLPAAVRMIVDELARISEGCGLVTAAVQEDNRGGHAIAGRLGFIDAGDHPVYPGARLYVLAR